MTLNEIKFTLRNSDEYAFLRDDPFLQKHMLLLTLGGSHAYGSNVEGSDLDIRGIAANPKEEILLGRDFEQKTNIPTDTTIYSVKKAISLFAKCNPNTIELLGCRPEHYLYLSNEGKMLIENRDAFLSKRAVYSFGGYANDQLHRLINATTRDMNQSEKEKHILGRINNASEHLKRRYMQYDEESVYLYVDESRKSEFDMEIFMDIKLKHYPLRDLCGLWSEMANIAKDYDKVGVRNHNALTHKKLGKHMMHLVRLYLMCFDILETGEIITFREKEHDFLMDIRNGKYLDKNSRPTIEFLQIVEGFEAKLAQLAEKAFLPERPDNKRIDALLMQINESILATL